ncbi:hypothetical protein MPSEU_000642700 [Mayamaea pseudoterrestris]|nr:hypothetical protein MPSEU_000642700 [Mayamaea pseudoterrestris]
MNSNSVTVASTAPSKDRILFASCSSQHYEQVLWPSVISRNASAFVWGGDVIYADSFLPKRRFWEKRKPLPATPHVIDELYARQLQDEGYKKLLETNSTIILGALDDHDYGINNGDYTYEHKTHSAKAFVNFLTSHRPASNLTMMQQRASSGKGVYGVKVLDFDRPRGNQLLSDEEAGIETGYDLNYNDKTSSSSLSNRSVAIFLLDVRSNKTPWNKHWKRKYQLDYEADFLGEEQWEWLEQGLQKSTAAVNIIVSGLQVHADRYYNGNAVEDWSRFPTAQHRLYQALLQSSTDTKATRTPVMIVSGDVHMAELLRKDCRRANGGKKQTLLEVTTSGMTHSWGTNICARPNLSLICQTPYFAWCLKMGMEWAHHSGGWNDVVRTNQVEDNARQGLQYALERNFGEFEFDWEKRRVIVRVLGEEMDDRQVLLSTSWDFDALSGTAAPYKVEGSHDADYERLYESLAPHGAQEDDWICVSYNGHPSYIQKFYGAFTPIFLSAFLASLPLTIPLVIAFILMRPQRRKGRQL